MNLFPMLDIPPGWLNGLFSATAASEGLRRTLFDTLRVRAMREQSWRPVSPSCITYDGNDNLLTRLTPKAETIVFAYDVVNQLLSKTLPGSLVTSYTYDPVGNLLTVSRPPVR